MMIRKSFYAVVSLVLILACMSAQANLSTGGVFATFQTGLDGKVANDIVGSLSVAERNNIVSYKAPDAIPTETWANKNSPGIAIARTEDYSASYIAHIPADRNNATARSSNADSEMFFTTIANVGVVQEVMAAATLSPGDIGYMRDAQLNQAEDGSIMSPPSDIDWKHEMATTHSIRSA